MSSRKNQLYETFKLFCSIFIWNENRFQTIQYIIHFLSQLQLIAIILSTQSQVQDGATGSLDPIVQNVSQLLSLSQVFTTDAAISLYNTLFAMLYVYMLLVFAFLAYLWHKCHTRKHFNNRIRCMAVTWAEIHHNVLFWMIQIFLLVAINQYQSMAKPILSISISSHGLLPLAILPLLFNYVIGIGTSIQCHDPFMTNNHFASYNSSFQVSSILYKIIAGPLMVFVADKDTLKWAFSVIALLMTYMRYELLYRTTPYFKWSAMRVVMTMTTCELAIALGFFLNCIFIQLEVTEWCHAIYIEIILMVILLRFSWLRVHNLAFEYISKPNKSLKNTIDVFKKLFALSFTHENAKTRSAGSDSSKTPNLSFMYLTGSVLNQQDLQEAKKDEIQILYYAEGEILLAALETFRYNNTFKLLSAYSLS